MLMRKPNSLIILFLKNSTTVMALKINSFLIPILIFCFTATLSAQTNNLSGIGFSFHKSAISNLTVNNYLLEQHSIVYGSPSNLNTPQYSYSVRYGRAISPAVIFFTGLEKIGMGHKFNVTLIEFHNNYNSPSNTPPPIKIFTEINSDIEIKLNYLKIPLTLYWKWMKDKSFGMFTSFSMDLGILTSATLIQDGRKEDYKKNLNPTDINYRLILGVRYDTDKYLFNLGLGFGNGFSDVEKKEKIGATIQNPSHNIHIGYFLSLNRKF